MQLVFDMDFLIFDAVSVAEERFITATHTPTGRKMEFPNKTKLWGDWRKKVGGWIGEENKKLGNDYWKAEDFEVVECQRPRPFKIKGVDEFGEQDNSKDYFISPWDGAKKIIDDKIKSICKNLGTNNYKGFTGKGNVFRHELSTLLYYKDRDDLLKPLLLDKMKEYVCQRHSCEQVVGIEPDDAYTMAVLEGYKAWIESGKKDEFKVIGVAEDKDSKGTDGWHYNPNKDKAPRLIEGFGKLWLTDKGDVDGCGRLWFYFQLFGDSADNYKANYFSDIKWADKKSYDVLSPCKNDREAWQALVDSFKILYPAPKTVVGWRGNEILIDWLYVLQEMANMALMLRKPDDKIVVKDVLDKLGISHGN